MENNHDLIFSQESFLCARQDGELVFIEEQPNGHIIRHATKPMTRAESVERKWRSLKMMIQAFSADRTDETLSVGVLPQ
jgi:hypothetical protein